MPASPKPTANPCRAGCPARGDGCGDTRADLLCGCDGVLLNGLELIEEGPRAGGVDEDRAGAAARSGDGSGGGVLRASQLDVEVQVHCLRHPLEGPERDVGIRRLEQRDLLPGYADSSGERRLRQAEILPRPSKLEANGEDRSR